MTCFKTERSAGVVAESENDATQRKCIAAVAIMSMQSGCLVKLSRAGLFLRNLDLALETVSNGAFAEIVGGCMTEPAEYVLYSSDSSPASCLTKLIKLFTVIPFNGTSTAHP